MTPASKNKWAREIFQPITDDNNETMTNKSPGVEVLSNFQSITENNSEKMTNNPGAEILSNFQPITDDNSETMTNNNPGAEILSNLQPITDDNSETMTNNNPGAEILSNLQPITDDNSETMTNNNPGAEVLSNSRHERNGKSSVDDEQNNLDVDDEMSPNRTNCNSSERTSNKCNMFSNQQMKYEVPSNNPTTERLTVGNHEQWNASIGEPKSLHDPKITSNSADYLVLENNNNSQNMEQCSTGLLHKRAMLKSDTEDDSARGGTTYGRQNALKSEVTLERHNKVICPTFESNVPLTEINCCSLTAVSGCPGYDNLGVNIEFQPAMEENLVVQKKCGCTNDHHLRSLNEKESNTINRNETKDAQEDKTTLPDYLKTLNEGKTVCGDTYSKFSKPDWFDKEKFQRGQRFAMNHIFGVMVAELISLMILFAFRGSLEPLIFTGKSDTPFKAFKRYLSTVARVKSWYEGDIWDEESEAHRNLKVVRGMHEAVRKSMGAAPDEELAKRVTLEGDGSDHQPMWTDLHEDIRDDFRSSCPFSGSLMTRQNEVVLSQGVMGITQFGFLGLILVFPKKFGVHFATDEDFEGFLHLWRTIGHLLGIDERYNLCNGDLQTVRQRCVDIIEHWVKPELRDVSRDWIHMSRCVFKGVSFYIINVQFEVMLMYLCNVLNIKAVKLLASLTLWQKFLYHLIEHLFWFTFRALPLLRLFNWMVNLAVKIARQFSPNHMMKLERIKYPYETSLERYYIRDFDVTEKSKS